MLNWYNPCLKQKSDYLKTDHNPAFNGIVTRL